MNHTKGPWTAWKYPDTKTWTVAADESVASKIKLAEDANLIAAAPELYEIVSLMANGAITYEDPRVLTALKKARGKI